MQKTSIEFTRPYKNPKAVFWIHFWSLALGTKFQPFCDICMCILNPSNCLIFTGLAVASVLSWGTKINVLSEENKIICISNKPNLYKLQLINFLTPMKTGSTGIRQLETLKVLNVRLRFDLWSQSSTKHVSTKQTIRVSHTSPRTPFVRPLHLQLSVAQGTELS